MHYKFHFLGTSLLRRNKVEPLNLGGLTKSAAAMMAAKHASALKASASDVGDGDIEVVGVVPGHGLKFNSKQQNNISDPNIINKLTQMPVSMDGKSGVSSSASSALARAAARQMAGSGLEDLGTASPGLSLESLQSAYSSIGGSNNSYTNLMASAAARDPYYQALLASALNGNSGNSASAGVGANTVDLLQKCKYNKLVLKISEGSMIKI